MRQPQVSYTSVFLSSSFFTCFSQEANLREHKDKVNSLHFHKLKRISLLFFVNYSACIKVFLLRVNAIVMFSLVYLGA